MKMRTRKLDVTTDTGSDSLIDYEAILARVVQSRNSDESIRHRWRSGERIFRVTSSAVVKQSDSE